MYGGAYGQYSAAVLPEGFPVIAFPDRSECEKSLSRDHHHMALTNLLGFNFPEACQRFAIADFVKPGPDANAFIGHRGRASHSARPIGAQRRREQPGAKAYAGPSS